MKYPYLNETPTEREMIDVFGGYNHNLRIGEGEFYEMKNLSSDNYPVLSPRVARGIFASPSGIPQGMIAKDTLCYVDGGDFIINGERVSMGLTVDGAPKTLISMGAYVIIMPDKKYINTADVADRGNIEANFITNNYVEFSLCKADGELYQDVIVSNDEPQEPENMALWLDTSAVPNSLKQYSSLSATWVSIASTYIKIESADIGENFSEGDGVELSNITVSELEGLNGMTFIQAKDTDYIVIAGIIDRVVSQTSPITVSRKMPNMDFVIESENRLWGCRYGTALNGDSVNEIYASKLGDFRNWNSYAGISTDSYAVTVGTDGPFTGAVAHLGYPIFFKENCMHKIYGSYPSNYQVQTTTCRGVQKGSSRSLAIVNETLFYKSTRAVCAYDGSLPVEISAALGDIRYSNAVGGALGNKYYISMKDADDEFHLFVFDALKNMWHREDDTEAKQFCSFQGDLYYIDRALNQIKTVNGTGIKDTNKIKWEATSGYIGTNSPDKKYISRLDVRLALQFGATVRLFIEYDSIPGWEQIFTMVGTSLKSFSIPVRPKRCDHLRLKLIGEGDAKIFSICKTIEQGSDI